ncbi:MAG: AAA family ATPase [Planctomycetota bacterium]
MPDPVDVYLLAGQSNMTGHGTRDEVPEPLRAPHPTAIIYFAPLQPPEDERPSRPHAGSWSPLAPGSAEHVGGFGLELSLGHTLAAQISDRKIALIKCERGGLGLEKDYRPQERDDPATHTNQLLAHAADAIEQLLEDGHDPRLAGFVWYQGESDADVDGPTPERYAELYRTLVRRITDELNDSQDFDKVVVRVNPHHKESPNTTPIRDQLVTLANEDPRAAWVDVDDLHHYDQLHLDGPALLTAGDRAAAALLELAQTAADPTPEATHPEPGSAPDTAVSGATETAPPARSAAPAENTEPPEPPKPKKQPPSAKTDPLPKPDQPRILALMNQKGGVGKTTTAVNVGAALANLGLNVLCIDLDPQAHLTLSLGIEPDQIEKSNYDLLGDRETTAMEVVRYTARDDKRLAVLPAETNLAGVESELAEMVATGLAQTILRNKCQDLVQQFDYVLIDCPPSLGLLTINALTMAHQIIVPMQAHFLALQGMTKLFETIGMVRQGINPSLTVAGVVLCMHEGNTLLANEVISELEGFFEGARGTDQPWADGRVFAPPIRRNIKLAEAPSFGQSVHAYAPDSNGAKDYLALARSIAGE